MILYSVNVNFKWDMMYVIHGSKEQKYLSQERDIHDPIHILDNYLIYLKYLLYCFVY